ncbi:MAG: hypothetical protein BWY80_00565 [Firmicutes bacterium ADurb.Bin456]|nr:MAG: hypothetical protein BWY80_00565 [Firmicutes bacterium ADurb.Bin456]
MRTKNNQRVQDYLSSICRQMMHKDMVKNKLENCLIEIIENKISKGIPEDKAIDCAMGQLGDPLQLGKNLRWLECLFSLD